MKWLADCGADLLKRLNYQTPSHIRVLMVDDSEDDYALAQHCLHEGAKRRLYTASIDLAHVADSEEAKKLICEDKHDIYLVDWRILWPGDGLQLIEDCVKAGHCGPYIVLSGAPEQATRDGDRMIESGVMLFLDKRIVTIGSGFGLIIQTVVRNYRLIKSLLEARG